MNEQEKELAIKIFDYFFKKAGVINVEVFDRNQEKHSVLKFPKAAFSLDVGVYIINPTLYAVRSVKESTTQNFMTFNALDSCADLVHICNFKTFELANMPNELKEAVVKSCIKQNVGIIYNRYSDNTSMTLIPQASSLEELAIMMELES